MVSEFNNKINIDRLMKFSLVYFSAELNSVFVMINVLQFAC